MDSTTTSVDSPQESIAELRQFLDRARAGDQSTLPQLRELLQDPVALDILGGNLARQAELNFVHNLTGQDLAFREALLHKLDLLRNELAGPNPTPVERLLVERVVACWLQVHDADVRYAQAQSVQPSPSWADYLQRRMDRAHRRYLSAIRTLELVRRLAVPTFVVNVETKQQVNVVGSPVNDSEQQKVAEPASLSRVGARGGPSRRRPLRSSAKDRRG